MRTPVVVMSCRSSLPLVIPKSTTIALPLGRTMMLDGLMSRWVRPASCAASRASATQPAMYKASGRGSLPAATAALSGSPGSSSITR